MLLGGMPSGGAPLSRLSKTVDLVVASLVVTEIVVVEAESLVDVRSAAKVLSAAARQSSTLLLHLQDEERRKFSRELHDSLGQYLAACKMGLEGIPSKRVGSPYVSGRSRHWIKSKNPAAPAVQREAEEDWGRPKWR